MILFSLLIIISCVYLSAKSMQVLIRFHETTEGNAAQTANEPLAHKLCMQSYAARNMPNTFAKIKADEEYEEALNGYVEKLVNVEAENTVSMIRPKVSKEAHYPLRAVK